MSYNAYKEMIVRRKKQIETLKGIEERHPINFDEKTAIKDAIDAMKYLIPYPAVIHKEGKPDEKVICPACWEELDPDEQKDICPGCGQLIDWTEQVDEEHNRR